MLIKITGKRTIYQPPALQLSNVLGFVFVFHLMHMNPLKPTFVIWLHCEYSAP